MMTDDNSSSEQWRPIAGYEGLYEVSDLGRVKVIASRTSTHAGDILKGYTSAGYRYVTLSKQNKRRSYLIARLVCAAFNPHPDSDSLYVKHKDDDLNNLKASNLEYVTPQSVNLRLAQQQREARKESGRVKLEGAVIARLYDDEGHTQAALSARYGVTQSTISRLIKKHKASIS